MVGIVWLFKLKVPGVRKHLNGGMILSVAETCMDENELGEFR